MGIRWSAGQADGCREHETGRVAAGFGEIEGEDQAGFGDNEHGNLDGNSMECWAG